MFVKHPEAKFMGQKTGSKKQAAVHGTGGQTGAVIRCSDRNCRPHCIENPMYVFPEKELRCLSPDFHIHVSVSDLYIFRDRSTYFPAAE
jgi:hypothetical protein